MHLMLGNLYQLDFHIHICFTAGEACFNPTKKTFLNNKTRKKLYTHATPLVPKKLKYKKWQLHLIAPMFKCPPRMFGFPLLDRVIWYLGWKKLHSFSSFIYLICYTHMLNSLYQKNFGLCIYFNMPISIDLVKSL